MAGIISRLLGRSDRKPRASAYDAAGSGRRTKGWGATSAGPNQVLGSSLEMLRKRSRAIVRNNGWASFGARVIESNVVGTGIKPQFATPDRGLNDELAALWLDWTDEADADGRLDFYGLQALAMREVVIGGEVFARLRARRVEDGLTVPLQLQLLEGDYCPVDKTEMAGTGRVVQGVETNAFGRRNAYWLYRQHPTDWVGFVDGGFPLRVPASEVLHLAEVRRSGQVRGEPWTVRAIVKMFDLDAYDDAELVRKKTAAMFAGFITKPGDEDDEIIGEREDVDSSAASVALEPGTMQELLPGEDVKFTQPTEVGNSYDPFLRWQLRAIAVGLDIPYELLTGDMAGVNDRTLRHVVNEFRRRCAMWQHHLLVFQFCRPVLRRWLDLAVLSGAVTPPRGMTARDFYRAKWTPERWPYIHPVQDVQAAVTEIRAGLSSRSQHVSERGYDAEQIDREQAADNARADELGLIYESDGRAGKAPLLPPPEEPEEKEPAR